LGFTPTEWSALASIVNAVLVLALVVVNIFYTRSATKQAAATHEQAVATREQASLANETINMTSAQLKQQSKLKLTEIIIDFRRLEMQLGYWSDKVRTKWGQGMPPLGNLLPDTWPDIVRIVETQAPAHVENILTIERLLTAAELEINGEMAQPTSYRSDARMKEAADMLDKATKPVRKVLEMLQQRSRE